MSRAPLRSVYHFFVAVWRLKETGCAWGESTGTVIIAGVVFAIVRSRSQ